MRLPDWIDAIGYGRGQLIVSVVGAGIWAADGAELLLISSVTRSIGKEWGLSGSEKGLVVSVVFVGVMVGNLLSGWLGDAVGINILIITRLNLRLNYYLIIVYYLNLYNKDKSYYKLRI